MSVLRKLHRLQTLSGGRAYTVSLSEHLNLPTRTASGPQGQGDLQQLSVPHRHPSPKPASRGPAQLPATRGQGITVTEKQTLFPKLGRLSPHLLGLLGAPT